MSVLVVGSINTDITSYGEALPRIGETVMGKSYAMELGGKGANQAAAAARLGAEVEFVGRVGDDAFGERALLRLAEFGASTTSFHKTRSTRPGLPSSASTRRGETPLRSSRAPICALAHRSCAKGSRALERAKVLMLQLEIPVAACLEAARAARERGVIVVLDPAPAPSAPLPDALYPLIDVITPNETEAEALLGFRPGTVEEAGRAARELVAKGVRAAIVTLGARGAFVACSKARRTAKRGPRPPLAGHPRQHGRRRGLLQRRARGRARRRQGPHGGRALRFGLRRALRDEPRLGRVRAKAREVEELLARA